MGMLKKLAIAAAVSGSLAAAATSAQAAPQLSVWTGYGPVTTVNDNGLGDTNPAAGVVSWSGGAAPWLINVDFGTTRPTAGYTESPKLRLDFTNTSYDIGEFTIMFTETGFDGTGELFLSADLNVTTPGLVLYEVWADSNDTPFGLQQLVTSTGSTGGAAGAGDTFDNPSGTYSLTQVVKIQHGVGANTTTGNARAEVPAPASLALLGLGLAGLGMTRRRRS